MRIARGLRTHGVTATGLVRSSASPRRLAARGIPAWVADLDEPATLQGLPLRGSQIYYLAPPPARGRLDTRMRAFLQAASGRLPGRVVYISTSGVYGDCAGAWVDETRPPAPESERARRRLDAEQVLAAWGRGSGCEHVAPRVGGIYGPGRLPIARLAGMTLICPQEAPYSNRIHSEDLARICIAAMARGRSGEVYNVADGHPTTMTDYLYRVADLAGLPRPSCVGLDQAPGRLSPEMLSFIGESRRLDIGKLRSELGVELRYPDLEQGLVACSEGYEPSDDLISRILIRPQFQHEP
jgi:nucleoside-diphosphate-sugar epimerase